MMVMLAQFCPSRGALGGWLLGSALLLAPLLSCADCTAADSTITLIIHDPAAVTQERIAARAAELNEQRPVARAFMVLSSAAHLAPSDMSCTRRPSAAAASENIYALKHAAAQLHALAAAHGFDGNFMQAALLPTTHRRDCRDFALEFAGAASQIERLHQRHGWCSDLLAPAAVIDSG
jgi:hypothetical protein